MLQASLYKEKPRQLHESRQSKAMRSNSAWNLWKAFPVSVAYGYALALNSLTAALSNNIEAEHEMQAYRI